MLISLLYVSRAVGPQTTAATSSILASAIGNNTAHGLTGVLCQGQGLYLQVLEGERSAVNRLYARILSDRRHTDLEILSCEEIGQRRFGQWSMAHVHLSDKDPMVSMKHQDFDPYSASGATALQILQDLLSTGTAIDAPVE